MTATPGTHEIWSAFEGCGSVLNLGAGTGGCEPTDRAVAAVEPSAGYDDPVFFGHYQTMRQHGAGLNEELEQPAITRLLPDVDGADWSTRSSTRSAPPGTR